VQPNIVERKQMAVKSKNKPTAEPNQSVEILRKIGEHRLIILFDGIEAPPSLA